MQEYFDKTSILAFSIWNHTLTLNIRFFSIPPKHMKHLLTTSYFSIQGDTEKISILSFNV